MKTISRARNNARLYIVQALYQKKISNNTFAELKIQYYYDNINRHFTDWNFFNELMDIIRVNYHSINKYIKNKSNKGIEFINYVDYAVLQAAIAELIGFFENPYQVIIKEYVKICYIIGTSKGYKFVNAVLHNVVKNIRKIKY